jgi:hypothetical protein
MEGWSLQELSTWAMFTTLYFHLQLTNGHNSPVCFPKQVFLVWCNVTLEHIGAIHKLRKN